MDFIISDFKLPLRNVWTLIRTFFGKDSNLKKEKITLRLLVFWYIFCMRSKFDEEIPGSWDLFSLKPFRLFIKKTRRERETLKIRQKESL